MSKLNRRGRIIKALREGKTLKCDDHWYIVRKDVDEYFVCCDEPNCCDKVISLEELFDKYIDDGYNWEYHNDM